MNRIRITVSDPDDLLNAAEFGTGAVIVVERSATGDGIGFDPVGDPIAIVAGVTAYTFRDTDGPSGAWYRTFYESADEASQSDYSAEFQAPSTLPSTIPVPSNAATVTTLTQVRALVRNSLSDDDLQEVIVREEEVLAGAVGQLAGERIETFRVTTLNAGASIRLRRPTSAVVVTEANVTTTDVLLDANGRTLSRLIANGWGPGAWTGVVEVRSTPNDGARVVSWVIELVRARLAESSFESETDGDYSYTKGQRSHADTMAAAVADILGQRTGRGGLRSVRMSTGVPGSAWIGSTRP